MIEKILNYLDKNKVKYNKVSDREYLIKIPKGVKMSSKAPKWFQEFKQENDQRWAEQMKFNNIIKDNFQQLKEENNQRWEKQMEFNKILLSLPTIQKEMKNIKK